MRRRRTNALISFRAMKQLVNLEGNMCTWISWYTFTVEGILTYFAQKQIANRTRKTIDIKLDDVMQARTRKQTKRSN